MTETWPAELLAYIDGIRASFNSREEADDYLKVGLMKKWGPLDRAVAPPAVSEAPAWLRCDFCHQLGCANPPPASPPEAQPAEQRKPE
jgi:hypothetical protein